MKITAEEKTALAILTVLLLAASLILYFRHTVPTGIITVHKADLREELTLQEVQQRLKEVRMIDINKASSSEFKAIPGVGDVLAERIVSYRNEQGGFTSPDELLEVQGIGPEKFKKIREYIKVD